MGAKEQSAAATLQLHPDVI